MTSFGPKSVFTSTCSASSASPSTTSRGGQRPFAWLTNEQADSFDVTDLGVLAAVLFSFANESADLVLSRPAALYSAEGRIDPGQITVKRLDGTSPVYADVGRLGAGPTLRRLRLQLELEQVVTQRSEARA